MEFASRFQRPPIFADMRSLAIVPFIDGRLRGDQDLASSRQLAETLAAFVRNNAKNPDGTPVSVVISNVVGGPAELDQLERFKQVHNVGAVLGATPQWCYGGEVLGYDRRTPFGLVGFNGTERPGAVFLNAAMSHCLSHGMRAFPIYGADVQPKEAIGQIPDDVGRAVLRFVRVGMAAAHMRGKSYLNIGGRSMGIEGSTPDGKTCRDYLGMPFQFCDMTEIIGRIQHGCYDQEEFAFARQWVGQHCKEGEDPNAEGTPHRSTEVWDDCVKMAMIIMDLMRGNPCLKGFRILDKYLGFNALFAGLQGQRQLTDWYRNGDFAEAVLSSSHDWTGPRMPYILATENDMLNGLCMLIGFLLTGSPQIFADLRTFWSKVAVEAAAQGFTLQAKLARGMLHLLNSGPACIDGAAYMMDQNGQPTMKPWWDVTTDDFSACLNATTWHDADNTYFPGGGKSTRFLTRGGMYSTMTRIVREMNGQLVMHILHGETVNLDPAVHNILDRRTNWTWPTTWFMPYATSTMGPYDYMRQWGANHCVLTPGHVGQDFRSLAALLGMRIGVTNLSESDQLLPIQWLVNGDRGLANDWNVVNSLGPLYA